MSSKGRRWRPICSEPPASRSYSYWLRDRICHNFTMSRWCSRHLGCVVANTHWLSPCRNRSRFRQKTDRKLPLAISAGDIVIIFELIVRWCRNNGLSLGTRAERIFAVIATQSDTAIWGPTEQTTRLFKREDPLSEWETIGLLYVTLWGGLIAVLMITF